MSEWKKIKLEDIVSKLGDGLHGTPKYNENGECYFINGNNLRDGKIIIKDNTKKVSQNEYLKYKKELNNRTIFLGINGTIGNVALFNNEKCILGKSVCYFNVVEKVNKQFIKYVILNKSFQSYLENFANGTTIKNVSLKAIREFELFLPPLPEQHAIASVLSSLDDKIDLLHRQNLTLEKMAETLFRQWFIEDAKEDWEEGTLKDEFDFIMGQSPSSSSFNEKCVGIPMYQGNRDFGYRFPTNRIFTTEAKRIAKKFDTLISVRAPVGEQNMANELCCIGRGVAAFRYKKNSNFYTYTYFKMKSLINKIKSFNNEGTVFGSISKSDFEKLEMLIPNKIDVDNFQDEVKPIDDKIILNVNQIRILEKMRDTLLPKLMSGDIRIKIN